MVRACFRPAKRALITRATNIELVVVSLERRQVLRFNLILVSSRVQPASTL